MNDDFYPVYDAQVDHIIKYGDSGLTRDLARALAAERAALRELREAVREHLAAWDAWMAAYCDDGDKGCVAEAAALELARRKVHALVGWQEGARDDPS